MRKILFLLKRFVMMIFTLLVASFLLFMLLRVTGTDPIITIVGEKQTITKEAKQSLREEYNLDKSLLDQYAIWLRGAVSGDFGKDYVEKVPVSQLISGRVSITVGMVVLSMVFSLIIAIPLGILCALRKNKPTDYILSTVMLVLTSIPGFLMAILVLIFLNRFVPGYKSVGSYANTAEYFMRIMAPAFCLALGNVASIGKITRNAMIEQLNGEYITTCKAKGLKWSAIVTRHALKNSVIPVFTITAMITGTMIGASVLVEQIFSLPGLGSLLTTAVLKANYPVVLALSLIILVMFQIINLVTDIMYTVLDPRIRL